VGKVQRKLPLRDWDFQILEPTVYVDEKLVVEKGKILSP